MLQPLLSSLVIEYRLNSGLKTFKIIAIVFSTSCLNLIEFNFEFLVIERLKCFEKKTWKLKYQKSLKTEVKMNMRSLAIGMRG